MPSAGACARYSPMIRPHSSLLSVVNHSVMKFTGASSLSAMCSGTEFMSVEYLFSWHRSRKLTPFLSVRLSSPRHLPHPPARTPGRHAAA